MVTEETTVTERWEVTIPQAVREELDVEPGDRIRWSVTEGGNVSVTVIQQRRGVLAEADPIDVGGETDAVELSDGLANGRG